MKTLLKYSIETILIIALALGGMYVFTLQRSEITAIHIETENVKRALQTEIDTLKAKNIRLVESMFVHDTISVYVFRGTVEEKK